MADVVPAAEGSAAAEPVPESVQQVAPAAEESAAAAPVPQAEQQYAPVPAAGGGSVADQVNAQLKWVEFGKPGTILWLKFNPVVTIGSWVILWVFIIVCSVQPDYVRKGLGEVKQWVGDVWTWLYIVSQNIWIVVLIYLMCSPKYGKLKLGDDNESPEYSNVTWFTMIFCCGVAVGLFYYGVAEPLWHYKSWGRFSSTKQGYGNTNEDAIHAMMVTWYHWGLHGWIPYTTMGAVLAIMTYRRKMPMTIRFGLWPLMGKNCCGIWGDIIDIVSVVTTIAGVCTSLGLGAMQVNKGFQRLSLGFWRGTRYSVPFPDTKYATATCADTGSYCEDGMEPYGLPVNCLSQSIIIVIITFMATLSVMSGLNNGIVAISRFTFALGMFLLMTVMFMGETWHLWNVITHTFGYYMWYLLNISFKTDAYEDLGSKDFGLGGAPDGVGGSKGWLAGWTIFYWGWWISWAPFCGMFLAKISRGRTLREFIFGTLFVPVLYSFLWMGVFGGEGIRMQRQADGAGLCASTMTAAECSGGGTPAEHWLSSNCNTYSQQYSYDQKVAQGIGYNPSCILDPDYHQGFGQCMEFTWSRKVQVGNGCVDQTTWPSVPCGSNPDPSAGSVPAEGTPCAGEISASDVDPNNADRSFNLYPDAGTANAPSCFVPMDAGGVCLYSQGTTDIYFDLLSSYGNKGFSDFLTIISLLCLTFYFVTSSDSGSLVVDILTANGMEEPPTIQRLCWSCTEGACAIALLISGCNLPNPEQALRAFQDVSIIMGLPYTFILFWFSQALLNLAMEEVGDLDPERPRFEAFLMTPLMWQGDIGTSVKNLAINTFCPGFQMGKMVFETKGWTLGHIANGTIWMVAFQALYLTMIIFACVSPAEHNFIACAGAIWIGFGTFLGILRHAVRQKQGIERGGIITDVIYAVFLPPLVLTQMQRQMEMAPYQTPYNTKTIKDL